MSDKKEQQYIIKESELLSFHMAAVLQSGDNKLCQSIVDGIRKRKISEGSGTQPTASNTIKAKIAAIVKRRDGAIKMGYMDNGLESKLWDELRQLSAVD